MPPRASTRSVAKVEDAGPSRPARTTRTAASKTAKKPDIAPNQDDEGLAKEMERVLRVSEPAPQPTSRAVRPAAASTVKRTAVNEVDSKPALKAVPSRTTVKASSTSASRPATAKPSAGSTSATAGDSISKTVAKPNNSLASIRPTTKSPAVSTSQITKLPNPDRGSTAQASSSTLVPARPSKAISGVQRVSSPAPSSKVTLSSILPTTSAVRRPVASSSKTSDARSTTPATAPDRHTTHAPNRAKVSLKGKEKEREVSDLSEVDYPWTDLTAKLSVNDRAQTAMSALKDALASLGKAAQSGYTYGATHDTWNADLVGTEIAKCDTALRVLRGMDEKGQLQNKGVEVEKAAQAVISKSIALGMPRRAFDQLVAARVGLIRQYKCTDPIPPKPTSLDTSAASTPIPKEWLDSGWLPVPEMPADMTDVLRTVCTQHVMAAWSCFIGLDGYGYDLPPLERLIGRSVCGPDWISPFTLALPLSAGTSAIPCATLTRRLGHIPISSPHWPRVFATIMEAFVLATSGEDVLPPGARAPETLWSALRKWLVAYVSQSKTDLDRIAIASKIISNIFDRTEEVITARRIEVREKWHNAASFVPLLEFWIDIARKAGDSLALERALGLMTTSSPNAASCSTAVSSVSVEVVEAHLNRLYAQLSLVEATLQAHANQPDLRGVNKSLEATEWESLNAALPHLNNDTKGRELFSRSFRSFERSRCLVRDLHVNLEQSHREPSRRWLLDATIAVEDALTETTLSTTSTYANFIFSAVGNVTNVLSRLPVDTSSAVALEMVERGKRLSRMCTNDTNRATCLRCLSQPVYSLSSGMLSAGKSEAGALVAQQAVEIVNEAIDSVRDPAELETKEFQHALSKRCLMYGNWSACLLSSGQHERALDVVCESLSMLPPTFYRQLEASETKEAVKATCESSDAANLRTTLERVAYTLCSDVEPIGAEVIEQHAAKVLSNLIDHHPTKVVLVLGEKVLECVMERAYKEEALQTAFAIGRGLLPLYGDSDGAINKLRLICKMTLLISSSGISQSDFNDLTSRATEVIDTLRSRAYVDATLIAEYHATILMVRAFQAYQINDEPTPHVIPLAVQAITELRQLLIPPTKAIEAASPGKIKPSASTVRGTSKVVRKPPGRTAASARSISASTPASKTTSTLTKRRRSSVIPVTQFDDVPRLTSMLTSLVSLLGLLGHITAKVDGIKVLRALIRHQEESVNEYIEQSAELASIYSKLGKHTRAATVFSQVLRTISEKSGAVDPSTQLSVHLRHCEHLASQGEEAQALASFADAEKAFHLIEVAPPTRLYRRKILNRAAQHTRLADANRALGAILTAQDDAAGALSCLKKSVKLNGWAVSDLALLASDRPKADSQSTDHAAAGAGKNDSSNPFVVAPAPPDKTGANQPTKDEVIASKRTVQPYENKYTFGIQWRNTENMLDAYIDLADAYAQRGSAKEAIYYLSLADATARAVRSSAGIARAATKGATLQTRMQKLDLAQTKIGEASTALTLTEGPDMFDLQRVKGDLLARQEMAEEANEVFEAASRGIHGLDTVFSAADALLPSPRKEALARASLSLSTIRSAKEPLLPSTLSHVLRRQAWLFREAGLMKESDELYRQVKLLQTSGDSKAEESYLAGKLALDDAFNHFQSDLFMSSLTESTIAMPMGTPGKKVDHRQSTRHRIQVILEQADQAYQSALTLVAGSGRVEDVRQACLSLALLRAFQTSLGQGGARVTTFAADLLASSTSIGLHRDVLEAIENKFIETPLDRAEWPSIDKHGAIADSKRPKISLDPEAEEDVTTDPLLVEYWDQVRARHTSRSYLSPESPAYDLSVLPETWAVVSMSVTEDRNTMFISRHQNGHEPLVFCLPLDRQSKREGEEEDVFTFEAGLAELRAIIETSDKCSSVAKTLKTPEEKVGWWNTKRALDKRMKELIDNVEFCWLGAFKTIFNPRQPMSPQRLQLFRGKIEKVFNLALFGSAHDSKKHGKVHLSDALLECFATLSSKSRDEEIEDFVYFILDIYQFHGVPVAVAELDLDQVGIDVVTALTEMEVSARVAPVSPEGPEHLLLALDKNVQAFPWESIPCLRGRPVSRVPSLPALLDQVALGKLLQPNSARRRVNSKKTHFILNPSGDLTKTQETFEPYLKDMRERAGWRGSVGQPPTEMEMRQILEGNDLVLYFGHGGGEQYIHGAKIRSLTKCATVFLWGCSSGKLEDQGDLDPAGTAWNYMMAGCPSLTATLWDVTDRDIDRFTHGVYKRLGLDPAHMIRQEKPRAEHSDPALLPLSGQGLGISTVEAVNASREDCKMTYLTGAAVVHYGIPVYIY